MSSSADSLKKKVCVTVFLDELFEEVIDEDRLENQVREVAGPQVEIIDTDKEPFPFGGDNDITATADHEQIQLRPRKHRKESKFSEKVSDLFKKELTKYGCDPSVKTNSESVDCGDSAGSDSDLDLDEILKLDHWALENSKTSVTSDLTDDSFLSINPSPSAVKIACLEEDTRTILGSQSSSSGKSRQSTSADSKDTKSVENFEKTNSNVLTWKKTHKEIQVILAKAQGKTLEVEGDQTRRYNLKSILEDCLKKTEISNYHDVRGIVLADRDDSDIQNLTDSYTCVFPHKQRKIKAGKTPEIKRVWMNSKRNVWNDGFESETEPDALRPVWKESLLCYNVTLKQSETIEENQEKNSDLQFSESSFDEIREEKEKEIVLRTITQLTNKSVLNEIFKRSQREEEIKNEGDILLGNQESLPVVENRNKNFAEGDFSEKPLKHNSKFELTKKLEIIPRDDKIIINASDIKLLNSVENLKDKDTSPPPSKEKLMTFFKKNMTDAESETVFAESENSCEGSEDFERPPQVDEKKDFILEFEDRLSHSRILRRIKTVEILGDSSLKSMKNISTEIILICENISNSEVCLEAWQSASKMSEMGQVYLKDSNNSAMYLLEIPLQFTLSKKEQPSEQCCKSTDME